MLFADLMGNTCLGFVFLLWCFAVALKMFNKHVDGKGEVKEAVKNKVISSILKKLG